MHLAAEGDLGDPGGVLGVEGRHAALDDADDLLGILQVGDEAPVLWCEHRAFCVAGLRK